MKSKLIRMFCALMSVFCLITGALAVQTYSNIMELYQQWSTTQMPDWVCSVVSADGSGERLAVVVTSQTAADELKSMLEDAASAEIIVAEGGYSYNELLGVQDEIEQEYMRPDGTGAVVSIGTGFAVVDGQVTGFGESGKEVRVVVGVQPEHVEEYRERFRKQYGDRVYVEESEGVTLDTAGFREPAIEKPNGYLIAGAALLIVAVAAGGCVLLKKKAAAKKT